MDIKSYEKLMDSLFIPQSEEVVEKWFSYYCQIDPLIGNIPKEEADKLGPLSKLVLVRMALQLDAIRDLLLKE